MSQVGNAATKTASSTNPKESLPPVPDILVADTNNNRIETWTPEHRFVNDAQDDLLHARKNEARSSDVSATTRMGQPPMPDRTSGTARERRSAGGHDDLLV